MKLQLGFVLLFIILGDLVETLHFSKFRRPHKSYRPKHHSHRPRSPGYRRPSIYGHSKKIPFKHPHYYRHRSPSDTWHKPRPIENLIEKEPVTIEIEFPKRYKSSKRITDFYNRNYGLKAERDYHSDQDDYLEDFEDEVMRLVESGLRMKAAKSINPKLRIKVSRDDSTKNIVKPTKSIAAASHLEDNPAAGFLNNFDRQNSQNRVPGYSVTEFPESYPQK